MRKLLKELADEDNGAPLTGADVAAIYLSHASSGDDLPAFFTMDRCARTSRMQRHWCESPTFLMCCNSDVLRSDMWWYSRRVPADPLNKPYELQTVARGLRSHAEHYIMSSHGITCIRKGVISEYSTLKEWDRHRRQGHRPLNQPTAFPTPTPMRRPFSY